MIVIHVPGDCDSITPGTSSRCVKGPFASNWRMYDFEGADTQMRQPNLGLETGAHRELSLFPCMQYFCLGIKLESPHHESLIDVSCEVSDRVYLKRRASLTDFAPHPHTMIALRIGLARNEDVGRETTGQQ